jgi:hypothetical protein
LTFNEQKEYQKIEKETADPERAAYGANTPLNPSKGRNEQSVLLVLIRRRLVGR